MSWSDKDIDKLYQDKTNELSFEYKDAYWSEFNATLPVSGAAPIVDEVDQMYQEGAEELAFDYKEAYWTEMEAMLPRRKRGDLLWFATSFIFIGLLVGSMFNQEQAGTFNSNVMAETSTSGVSDFKGSEIRGFEKPEMSESNRTEDNVSNSNLTEANDFSASQQVNSLNFNSQNSSAIAQTVSTQEIESNSSVEALTSIDRNEIPNEIVPVISLNSGDPETNTTSELENIAQMNSNEEELIIRTQVSLNETLEGGNESLEITQTNIDSNVENTTEVNDRVDVGDLPLEKVTVFENLNENRELASIHQMDLPVTRPSLYIEMNGGLSQSLITPSESMSYSGGIGIGAQFHKGKFSFTTGINGLISFHDDLVLTREAKVYGFGSEVYKYTLKFDQLYTLEANLSVGLRLGSKGRHQLSLGVRPSYVLGTKVGYSQDGENVEDVRGTMYGYTEGIKRFGIKPMIGYSFEMKPSWIIGLNVGTQVMQSVNEDFITGKNSTMPIDGQLYIRKTLRFRK